MYMIKTDEELRMERKILVEKRKRLLKASEDLIEIEENLRQECYLIRDPGVRAMMHREIHEVVCLKIRLNSMIDYLSNDIWKIDASLKPRNYRGSIYDTYQDLNYEEISIYGIHGVKL